MRNLDLRLLSPVVRRRLGDETLVSLRTSGGLTVRHGDDLVEARDTRLIEARSLPSGEPSITGYATVYGESYPIYGGSAGGMGGWDEIVNKGAAAKSVRENDDVHLFFDHEGLPLASTKDGTLLLTSDSKGLRSDGTLDSGSTYSMEVYRRVQQRKLDKMSFAFTVTRERWEDEGGNEADPMTAPVRRILEVKLYDTSVVSFPANPATSVQPRSQSAGMSLTEAKAARDALRVTA